MLEYVKFKLATGRIAWLRDQRAVTAIEYGLIAALIAVAIITAVSSLGNSIGNTFNKVATSL